LKYNKNNPKLDFLKSSELETTYIFIKEQTKIKTEAEMETILDNERYDL